MIPDTIFAFILGILTCAFCFLLFRDIIIMHLFKNSQAVQITTDGIKNIQQIEQDLNSKLSIYIKVLLEVRKGLTVLYSSVSTLDGTSEYAQSLQDRLIEIDKELNELEEMGLIVKEDEK